MHAIGDRMFRRQRYRWRTRLRTMLPYRVALKIPKGARDCGSHDWYMSSDEHDLCYHCRVGRRSPSQLTPRDESAQDWIANKLREND